MLLALTHGMSCAFFGFSRYLLEKAVNNARTIYRAYPRHTVPYVGISRPFDRSKLFVYFLSMIKSFRCRETERIFRRETSRRFPLSIQQRAFMKLNALDAALTLEDLHLPPSNQLEALKKERKGQWSIRINQQWRICFKWMAGHAEQVEIVDYH